jgi:hypothetical protein
MKCREQFGNLDGLQISVIELVKTGYHVLRDRKDVQITWLDLIRQWGRMKTDRGIKSPFFPEEEAVSGDSFACVGAVFQEVCGVPHGLGGRTRKK